MGSTEDESYIKMYDPYLGLEIMLPYAKGVGTKAYNFNQTEYILILNMRECFFC